CRRDAVRATTATKGVTCVVMSLVAYTRVALMLATLSHAACGRSERAVASHEEKPMDTHLVFLHRRGDRDGAVKILGELALDPQSTLGTEMLAKTTLAQVVR